MRKTYSNKITQNGPGYQLFYGFNILFLTAVILATAYPIYFVLIASFSDPASMNANYGLMMLPKFPLSIRAYKIVFNHPLVLVSYKNTIVILVVGLLFNLSLSSLGAYFLTLNKSMWHKPIAMLILFSMYFSGGLVPMYLNVRSLGLMDSTWSLILPVAISTYNMLVMRSAFAAIPDSLVEAARLDGASHFRILTTVILPLTGAMMAVMVLYYGVAHWNAWFNASLYIQTPTKYPLQLVLRQVLILGQNAEFEASTDMGDAAQMSELIKYSLIIVSTVPILMLYPFLQRFFVKGVMVGALKG
ncbi:MAG: carbohydrate ABC transporter permease [Eubacteriales bacterium]|nr:carbohydrate ABC transporter permease [Eubacteriales bacterium]MDD4745624.1 carbohydrate ABC transporter permease [Eubacteriales bacterium]